MSTKWLTFLIWFHTVMGSLHAGIVISALAFGWFEPLHFINVMFVGLSIIWVRGYRRDRERACR